MSGDRSGREPTDESRTASQPTDEPDSTRTASEPTDDTTTTMTDKTTTETDDTTTTSDDTTTDSTDERPSDESTVSFPPECRQSMKDMDHSPPVDGANRTFERKREGRPAKTDGGPRADQTGSDGGTERPRRTMKDVDHSPPVDGANRTFERGTEEPAVDDE